MSQLCYSHTSEIGLGVSIWLRQWSKQTQARVMSLTQSISDLSLSTILFKPYVLALKAAHITPQPSVWICTIHTSLTSRRVYGCGMAKQMCWKISQILHNCLVNDAQPKNTYNTLLKISKYLSRSDFQLVWVMRFSVVFLPRRTVLSFIDII